MGIFMLETLQILTRSEWVRMGPKARVTERDFFRQPLLEQINLKHPLVRLAGLIDWERLGTAMSESFVSSA
jgi:IS5 family transposase